MTIAALDFDGVLCHSARELAHTGWHAAAEFWPGRFTGLPPDSFIRRFVALRPVIETGYQSILLAALIADDVPAARIFDTFDTLCVDLVLQVGATLEHLIASFGRTRDAAIASDPNGWLALHDFYDGTLALLSTLAAAADPVYIVSTRQRRFITRLLEYRQVVMPEDCVFGLDDGSKESILGMLLNRHRGSAPRMVFVEDRLSTLERLRTNSEFDDCRFFLADWGYVTPADRQQAAGSATIELLSLERFVDGSFLADGL